MKRLLSVLLVLALALSLAACGAGAYEVRFELNGGELVSGKLLQQVTEGDSPKLYMQPFCMEHIRV